MLREQEARLHRLVSRVVASWDSDEGVAAEVAVLMAVAVVLLGMLTLCTLGSRAKPRACAALFLASAWLTRELLLFTASRCGALPTSVESLAYPASWPWVGGAPNVTSFTRVPRVDVSVPWSRVKELGMPVIRSNSLDMHDERRWTPGEIAERLRARGNGEERAPIYLQLGHPEQQEVDERVCSLVDFLARLEEPEWVAGFGDRLPYLAETALPLLDTEYLAQRVVSSLLPQGFVDSKTTVLDNHSVATVQLLWWIGPAGARSGLHKDPYPLNVLFILSGSKTVWLYPPSENGKLYPEEGIYDYGATVSQVDPFVPDLERFPLFASARAARVDLGPGDALYVPAGWYHYAQSETTSVSITGRVFTTCELVSFWDTLLLGTLKHLGMLQLAGMSATDARVAGSGGLAQEDACAPA